jgi:hypothetical protein
MATRTQLRYPLLCEGYNNATVIPVMIPTQSVICKAGYMFDQVALEAGPRIFTANFTSWTDLGVAVPAAASSITVTPQLTPGVTATVLASSCVIPTQPGVPLPHDVTRLLPVVTRAGCEPV